MKRFNFYLPDELYNRIKLMADFYNKPMSKIIVDLLEIGYLEKLSWSKPKKPNK